MKKINIAELLKDCPKGTKLYSPITGECTLNLVDNNGCDNVIRVNFYGGEDEVSYTSFYKYGNYFHNGECLLFPSKGKTTWEGFQRPFKDGDIITVANESNPFILHYESNGFYNAHCALLCGDLHVFTKQNNWVSTHREYRFATEEEKEKLFQAIKDNGYKWNQETKTLEKLRFKNGDILANGDTIFIYNGIEDNLGYGTYVIIDIYGAFAVNIPTKKYGTRLATEKEKQKLFEAIKENGYKWNAETKTLEKLIEPKFKAGDRIRNKNYKDYIYDIHDITDKGYRAKEINADSPILILFGSQEDNYELVSNKFDINTLVPFESRVLVRDTEEEKWKPAIWGYYDVDHIKGYPYETVGGNCFLLCIPYEGNEHLLNTTDACNDYFKTWEK